ncbi:hypothetical protein [Scleromatobacter humisilvae]|uniref:Transmembrane protein n=1 Tax=Scleromatobacter humisilvae TaxID=2897159 RepID=A0A9X1YF77_9BURK|nr:hypothetical protein [Scleromatobacter humisilvae]MCK9684360.1 hypothetical protein [Scleromatobacter humisilvae]
MHARKSSLVALALALAGFAAIVVAAVDEPHRGRFALAGGLAWELAYFAILAQNFSERAPLQTRGGPVTWEKSPRIYVVNFIVLGLLGLFALVVLLAIVSAWHF